MTSQMKVLKVLGVIPVFSSFFAPSIPQIVTETINLSEKIARKLGSKTVETEHLFIALLKLEKKYNQTILGPKMIGDAVEKIHCLEKALGKIKAHRGKVKWSDEALKVFQDPESNITTLEEIFESFIKHCPEYFSEKN